MNGNSTYGEIKECDKNIVLVKEEGGYQEVLKGSANIRKSHVYGEQRTDHVLVVFQISVRVHVLHRKDATAVVGQIDHLIVAVIFERLAGPGAVHHVLFALALWDGDGRLASSTVERLELQGRDPYMILGFDVDRSHLTLLLRRLAKHLCSFCFYGSLLKN
jgi:hypothetical protein